MQHRQYTEYLRKELDFLKLLISRFHEQEKLTELEVDIALLRTQDIYEQLLRLKLNSGLAIVDMPQKNPEPQPELSKSSEIEENVRPISPVREDNVKEKKPEEPKPAPVKPEKEESIAVKETCEKVQPAVNEEKSQEKKAEPKQEKKEVGILADKISPQSSHLINETIAQKKPDLSSRLQTAPLASIASGIGINDRFLYIRELFQGNADLYSDTVRQLDVVESIDDALDFIERHFSWNKEDEAVLKFLHLVQRRHGTSGSQS